ncbi:MAG: hypothetical protein ACOYMG_24385 [Candidatus Methylumidiphilus sp.]|jgi:uncharacterized membrane protein
MKILMLRRIGFGLLFSLIGFILAGIASYFLIMELSPNMHDRSVEASMTGIFFFGPIGAILGFVAGAIWSGPRASKPI